jgi:hypothetical protein
VASELDAGEVAIAESSASRSRRGRGRQRAKPRAEPIEPSAGSRATWVRVGPGKFVRVEAPELRGEAAGQPLEALSSSALPSTHWGEAASPLEIEAESVSADEAAPEEEVVERVEPALAGRVADDFTDLAEYAQAGGSASADGGVCPEAEAPVAGGVLDEGSGSEPEGEQTENEIPSKPLDDENFDETTESDEPAIRALGMESELGEQHAASHEAELEPSCAEVSGAFLFGRGRWTAGRKAVGQVRSLRSNRSAWPRRVVRQLHCHLRRSSGRDDRMARTFQPRAPP